MAAALAAPATTARARDRAPGFPLPVGYRLDPAQAEVAAQRAAALRDVAPFAPAAGRSGCAPAQPGQRTAGKLGACPGPLLRNDTAPFLYGDTYVIQIFVDDNGGSWADASWNPFEPTRQTAARTVREATEWIESRGTWSGVVDFNTSGSDVAPIYNATIDAWFGFAEYDLMTTTVPEAIGFTDGDGDGEVLDDLLEFVRTLDGGGWENVVAVFHVRHDDRAYAYDGIAATACFNAPSAGTFAHEILHLYGASDEYEEGGTCGGSGCGAPVWHPWIETDYPNDNCELCTGHGRCIMIDADLGSGVCVPTREHVGWGDDDGNGIRDLAEARPWAEIATPPATGPTANPQLALAGTAFEAFRWTGISRVDFRVNGGPWQQATAADGDWGGFEEGYALTAGLTQEGTNTVEVQARTSAHVQNCTVQYAVDLDRTGPPAPWLSSGSHPDPAAWSRDTAVRVSWDDVFDAAGIAGYSVHFDLVDAEPDADLLDPDDVPASPFGDYERTFSAAATGVWHLRLRSVDALGNPGPSQHVEFRIDLAQPDVPAITSSTHPDPDTPSNLATATFEWSSDDAHAGIAGYAWGLDRDPAGTAPTTSWQNRTSADVPVPVWPPGAYHFHVAARDHVGNWSPFATYTIQVDRSGPNLSVSSTSHPDPGRWYGADDATFTWTLETAETVLGYSITHAPVGAPPADPDETLDTPSTSVTIEDLPSGEHWFGVRAQDAAGNWSTTAWTSVRIDATDPGLVQNLSTSSHDRALGERDCQQSADRTVDVQWSPASDAHAGVSGYDVGWSQQAEVFPATYASLGLVTTATSGSLDDGSWYCLVRAVDAAGNVDDEFASHGPIHIEATPPAGPASVIASAGNATVTVSWSRVLGEGAVTYEVYRRRIEDAEYGSPIATGIQDTVYTDAWPAILNGDVYQYAVSCVDSCGVSSALTPAGLGAPEYASPGDGSSFTLAQLVAASKGGIRGAAPAFTLHGTVTITANDRLDLAAGETLLSQDRTGTKKLRVLGTLVASGTQAALVVIASTAGAPGSWGGLELASPGGASRLDFCTVRDAATGILWNGGSPAIRSCTVERCSGDGIAASASPGAACIVDANTVRRSAGRGIFVFGTPGSTTSVTGNQVDENGAGIAYDVDPGQMAPQALTVASNTVRRQTGDGIACGRGALAVTVNDNTVLENESGIVFDSYGQLGGAAPVVHSNLVSGNRVAGVRTSVRAAPVVRDNVIVQNLLYGIHSRTDATPTCYRNTIAGSTNGVFVEQSTFGVPDLGSGMQASPGMNRLDGHVALWVRNDTGVAVNAMFQSWGAAQPPPGQPPSLNGQPVTAGPVNWNPVWAPPPGNQPPVLALTAPAGGTARDAVAIAWTDDDPDDDARINLFYDTDGAGLDGVQIAGAAGLSENDETDAFTWNTRLVPAGTYHVYAVVSDDETTRNAYAPGEVTIQHPGIAVAPDSLRATVPPAGAAQLALVIRNAGTADLAATLAATVPWIALGATALALAPGDSAAVAVGLDAASLSEGDHAGAILVGSDDHTDSLVTVAVGLGVEAPEIELAAASLDFGGVGVGSSRTLPLVVRNAGTGALLVQEATAGGRFAVSGATPPVVIAPGDSLPLALTYTPAAPGADTGTLAIRSTDADEDTLQVSLAGTGLAPEIRLVATTHDFGSVGVGASATWTVAVTNDGTTDLRLAAAAFDAPGFVLQAPPLAASIPPATSADLAVGFFPVQPGPHVARLFLQTNDPDQTTVEILLSGNGSLAESRLSGTPHDFGTVPVGAAALGTLWVRNTGAHPLAVIGASTLAPFEVVSPALPASVSPGDSLGIGVRFAPAALGAAERSVAVTTDAANAATLLGILRGSGVGPDVAALPALDLGTVHADSTRAADVFLHNGGEAALAVSSLALRSGQRFAVLAPTPPVTIAAGDSAAVRVAFLPSPVGEHADTLLVGSDDPDEPVVAVRLAARAALPEVAVYVLASPSGRAAEVDVTAAGYDFGGTSVGQAAQRTFRIRNRGGWPLAVQQVQASPAAFAAATPSLPASVLPGGALTVQVTFTPGSTGTVTGTLAVQTDDPETPALAVPLAGHGADAVASVAPATLAATVFEGGSTELALRLANGGAAPFAFCVRDNEGWIAVDDSTGWVAGNDTVDVAVRLDAAAAGAGVHQGQLVVLTSDADLDTARIDVRLRVPRMRFADHTAAFRATVTDEGAFGFYDMAQSESYGSGFVYPLAGGASHLFHGSLWVGTGPARVSDASYDADFEVVPDSELVLSGTEPQRSTATFRDTGSPAPLGVEVRQEGLSRAAPENDDFLVLDYTVRNVSGSPLAGLYVALYMDWDVGAPRQNAGAYDSLRAVGYMYHATQADPTHVGIVMLHPPRPASVHFVHHPTSVYPYGTVRDADKYAWMSDGAVDAATWQTEDWSMMVGAGPFDLAPGAATRVSFALVAGTGLQALLAHAAAARTLLATDVAPVALHLQLEQNVPNPFNPATRIAFELPRAARTRLAIYDVRGRAVTRLVDGALPAGRHHVVWDGRDGAGRGVAAGVYFYRLDVDGETARTRRMVLLE